MKIKAFEDCHNIIDALTVKGLVRKAHKSCEDNKDCVIEIACRVTGEGSIKSMQAVVCPSLYICWQGLHKLFELPPCNKIDKLWLRVSHERFLNSHAINSFEFDELVRTDTGHKFKLAYKLFDALVKQYWCRGTEKLYVGIAYQMKEKRGR